MISVLCFFPRSLPVHYSVQHWIIQQFVPGSVMFARKLGTGTWCCAEACVILRKRSNNFGYPKKQSPLWHKKCLNHGCKSVPLNPIPAQFEVPNKLIYLCLVSACLIQNSVHEIRIKRKAPAQLFPHVSNRVSSGSKIKNLYKTKNSFELCGHAVHLLFQWEYFGQKKITQNWTCCLKITKKERG